MQIFTNMHIPSIMIAKMNKLGRLPSFCCRYDANANSNLHLEKAAEIVYPPSRRKVIWLNMWLRTN